MVHKEKLKQYVGETPETWSYQRNAKQRDHQDTTKPSKLSPLTKRDNWRTIIDKLHQHRSTTTMEMTFHRQRREDQHAPAAGLDVFASMFIVITRLKNLRDHFRLASLEEKHDKFYSQEDNAARLRELYGIDWAEMSHQDLVVRSKSRRQPTTRG